MTTAPTKTNSAEDLEILNLVEEEYRFYKDEVIDIHNTTLLLYDRLPDGMLGDIRDCFGHLCDAVTRTEQTFEKRRSNVENAHRHLRRFILDCYKIQCIWYRDQLRAFDKKYRWSNLNDVRDGRFRPEYTELRDSAKNAFQKAQRAERPGNNDRALEGDSLDDVYELYERALNDYMKTLRYIEEARPAVERVAYKDIRRTVISVLGWVISAVLAIISIKMAK